MRLKSLYALALIATIWAHPSHADDLDTVVDCGIRAYADSQPGAGSWAQQLIRELKEDHPQTAAISLHGVKFWMISNQRQDGDLFRIERMATLAHAIASCAAPLPDQPITTDALLSKADGLLLELNPPPIDAGESEEMKEMSRRKAEWIATQGRDK